MNILCQSALSFHKTEKKEHQAAGFCIVHEWENLLENLSSCEGAGSIYPTKKISHLQNI